MNRIKLIIIIGSILIAIALGVYFFISTSKSDDLFIQRDKIQTSLTRAEEKLKKEKQNLESLKQGLKESFPLAVSVQGQMKDSFEVVKTTDFMFNNPYGLNPELIVKSSLDSLLLNNQRKDINKLLIRWQKEIDLLSVDKININEIEKIKKDIEVIKSFIKNLTEVVKDLTPGNSGLTQYQIDTYSTQFAEANNINQILISIENAIKNPSAVGNDNTSFNNNTNTSGDVQSNPSSQPPVIVDLFTNKVLPADVFAAQVKIEETQSQIDTLKTQLAEIEKQIQTPAVDNNPAPIPVVPVVETPGNIETIESIGNQGIQRIKYEGILIQPGPPRLIQGSDAY